MDIFHGGLIDFSNILGNMLGNISNYLPDVTHITHIPTMLAENIPGVPSKYISAQGQEILIDLFKVIRATSLKFFKLLTLIAFGIGLVHGERFSLFTIFKQLTLTVILFIGINFVFGNMLSLGVAFGEKILTEEKALELQKLYGKKADEIRDKGEAMAAKDNSNFFDKTIRYLGKLQLSFLDPAVGVMFLSHIAFVVVAGLLNLLWTILSGVLYVFSPLLVALGVIPGLGVRILSNWFGAIFQLAALKVWLTFCAFMVDITSVAFLSKSSTIAIFDLETTYGLTVLNLTFFILYILGPILIPVFIPFSGIVSGLTQGIVGLPLFAANQAAKAAKAF